MNLVVSDLLNDLCFSKKFDSYFSTLQMRIQHLLMSFNLDLKRIKYFINMYKTYEKVQFTILYKYHFKNQKLRDFLRCLIKMRNLPLIRFDDSILHYLEGHLGISVIEPFDTAYHEYTLSLWKNFKYDEENMLINDWRIQFIECDSDDILNCLEEYKKSPYHFERLV